MAKKKKPIFVKSKKPIFECPICGQDTRSLSHGKCKKCQIKGSTVDTFDRDQMEIVAQNLSKLGISR